MRVFRTIPVLALVASLAVGQMEGRLWLVRAPALGTNAQVLEVGREGVLYASHAYPGPNATAVAADPIRGCVYVCDPNSQGGMIHEYRATIGLVASHAAPGARSLAVMTDGDVAVLEVSNPLLPSRVQVVPGGWFANPTLPWPPAVTVGASARQMVAGPNGLLWVHNVLSNTVSRIENGQVLEIAFTHLTSYGIQAIAVRSGGGLAVTFHSTPLVVLVDAAGSIVGSTPLPEPIVRSAVDLEDALVAIGGSGTLYGIQLTTGQIEWSTSAGLTAVQGLFLDHRRTVRVEITAPAEVRHYDHGGALLRTLQLSTPTATSGDPMGFEFVTKVNPMVDSDGDGFSGAHEIYCGSDPLDSEIMPARITPIKVANGRTLLSVSAPSYPGAPCILLLGVSGAAPIPLGPGLRGAPYFSLTFDSLTWLLTTFDARVQPIFLGLPLVELDATGVAYAGVDFSPAAVVWGTPVYACALVIPAWSGFAVTSKPIVFPA